MYNLMMCEKLHMFVTCKMYIITNTWPLVLGVNRIILDTKIITF